VSPHRIKLIVAVVLGVVFLAVLCWDPSASEDAASETTPVAASPPLSAPKSKSKSKGAATSTVREADWPKVAPEDAEELNPFDPEDREKRKAATVVVEEPAPAEELEQSEQPTLSPAERMKAAFANKRVRMILRTRNGVIGLIDNEVLREGEIVEGVRIVSIRADGVLVEPVDEESAAPGP
jgi:hypothetical protein